MRKAVFAYSKNKGADELCRDQLFSAFIFNLNLHHIIFRQNSNIHILWMVFDYLDLYTYTFK